MCKTHLKALLHLPEALKGKIHLPNATLCLSRGGQTWLGVTAGALASPRLVFLLPEEEAAGVGAAPSPCFCGWVWGWEVCEGGGFLWFVCLMCRKRFSPSSWVCHLPFCHPCPPAPREAVGGSSTPHPALLPTPPPPLTAPQSSAFSRGLPLRAQPGLCAPSASSSIHHPLPKFTQILRCGMLQHTPARTPSLFYSI